MDLPHTTLGKISESNFKKYLKSIPNSQLIQFYNDVEWTPFPILVINEYQNRFNPKIRNKTKLKTHNSDTTETKKTLSITKKSKSLISSSIKHKQKNFFKSTPHAGMSPSAKDFLILERLLELNKKKIITNKEFQDKKKEVLKRI